MAKKLGINNPLFENVEENKEPKKVGRKRNEALVRDNAVQNGLTEDLTRATFILKVDNLNKLKDYAYTKRITIKDAINEAIESFINDYEADPKNERLLEHKK